MYDFTHMEENALLTGVADNFLRTPHRVNYQLLWSPVSDSECDLSGSSRLKSTVFITYCHFVLYPKVDF